MAERYNYDEKSDSVYIFVKEGLEDRCEEIVPGISVELNEKGEVIGIEILKASRFREQIAKQTVPQHAR